ncbi:MAG: AAA family ATPase [Candidatus Korarchaeota archaeon]
MRIVITGVPGSGKTKIAKELSKITGWTVLNVGLFIRKNNLVRGISKQTGTMIVDEVVARSALAKEISKYDHLIIDTHLSEIIPLELINHVIVLHVPINVLLRRLKSRGWSQRKIDENILSEMETLYEINPGEKEIHIDVDEKDAETVAREILQIIDTTTE